MRNYIFDGKSPLKNLHFLATFKRKSDQDGLEEGAALLVLPDVQTGTDLLAFNNLCTYANGLPTYPEAVQYLLRQYAKSDYLDKSLNDF